MWFKYLVIASYVIEAIGYITMIGDERKTVTKELAVFQVIVSSLFIAGILHYWK